MLEKRFINTLKGLCDIEDRILVAVSGGKDSMALLELFRTNGYKIEVAHFNYKLREEDSENDELLVTEYCTKYALTLHINSANTKKTAKEKGVSTQIAARELRYSWFTQLLNDCSLNHVATAHHLNDNLETLLLNITKGTGPKGLTAIPAKTGNIIRPLLSFTSEEIKAYLVEKNVKWRDDLSNFENNYSRNRIRNRVVPELKIVNPGLEDTFKVNLDRLRNLNQIFTEQLKTFESKVIKKGNSREIPLNTIENTTGNALILEEYLKPFGFNYHDIQNLLSVSSSGKTILSKHYQLVFQRSYWLLTEREEDYLLFTEIELTKEGKYDLGDYSLTIKTTNKNKEELDFSNPNIAYLDSGKLTWPLKVRTWKQGDKFKPFGMKGTKLVSDFLMDLKIPITEKNKQLVLESNHEIAWVLGHRINNDYRINQTSLHFLCLKLEKQKKSI